MGQNSPEVALVAAPYSPNRYVHLPTCCGSGWTLLPRSNSAMSGFTDYAMTEQDRARWVSLVADFEASDLTQREFATGRLDSPPSPST